MIFLTSLSFTMDLSNMKDNVFPLSEDGNSKIEFKTYRFLLHSHKEGVKPITLTKKEMYHLCEKLPILQKEMAKLMESIDEGNSSEKESKPNSPIRKNLLSSEDEGDEEPPESQKKQHNDSDQNSEDQLSQKKILENKIWKSFVISTYKHFETKLLLNTYEQKPYIWLRLYFDANNNPTETKKRKKKDMKPCRGGIIFNDVNTEKLTQFVKKM